MAVTFLTYQWGQCSLLKFSPLFALACSHAHTHTHTHTNTLSHPHMYLPTLSHTHLTDIDSQLEHTSHLLDQLQDQQRDRLSQAPLELDDGHLMLPGPSDEEVRIASNLRAGLAQLTAQVCTCHPTPTSSQAGLFQSDSTFC